MIKKFLLSFLLILVYMIVFALLFLPILIFQETKIFTYLIALWAGSIIIFYPFYFNLTTKFIWTFKSLGNGRKITEEELREIILKINNYDSPIMIKEKKKKIIATWKYIDAKWWEILKKRKLKKIYELHIKFNAKTKTVVLIDVLKSVSWGIGPTKVKVRGGYFRGIIIKQENFQLKKIYDKKFNPAEIKYPIMNTIRQSGWQVKFAIF